MFRLCSSTVVSIHFERQCIRDSLCQWVSCRRHILCCQVGFYFQFSLHYPYFYIFTALRNCEEWIKTLHDSEAIMPVKAISQRGNYAANLSLLLKSPLCTAAGWLRCHTFALSIVTVEFKYMLEYMSKWRCSHVARLFAVFKRKKRCFHRITQNHIEIWPWKRSNCLYVICVHFSAFTTGAAVFSALKHLGLGLLKRPIFWVVYILARYLR